MKQITHPDELIVGRSYWVRNKAFGTVSFAEIEFAYDGGMATEKSKRVRIEHCWFELASVQLPTDSGWTENEFFGPIPVPVFAT